MSHKMPRAAVLFMAGTIAVGLALGLWEGWTAGFPTAQVIPFAAMGFLGAMALLYPIRSAQTTTVTYMVTSTFLFAAIILLSGGWLALQPVVVWIPMTVKRYFERKPGWLLLPMANAGLTVTVAVLSRRALVGWSNGHLGWLDIGLMVLVMLGYVLAQSLWVAVLVQLTKRVPVRLVELWQPESLMSDIVLLCLGAIVAMLWEAHPAALILVMGPVGFAYYMLRGVQLIRLGEIDGKTGLYNSRRFEEQFGHELSSAKILRRTLSVVFLDLDFLRNINNNYGHLAGDVVITGVAERIRANLRPQDFAARFGGEEYVLLLPGTEILEAQWIAEKIRQAVAEKPFDIGEGQRLSCSISGGVAAFPTHGKTIAELTASADAALYLAKGQGRNRICIADEVPNAPAQAPKTG